MNEIFDRAIKYDNPHYFKELSIDEKSRLKCLEIRLKSHGDVLVNPLMLAIKYNKSSLVDFFLSDESEELRLDLASLINSQNEQGDSVVSFAINSLSSRKYLENWNYIKIFRNIKKNLSFPDGFNPILEMFKVFASDEKFSSDFDEIIYDCLFALITKLDLKKYPLFKLENDDIEKLFLIALNKKRFDVANIIFKNSNITLDDYFYVELALDKMQPSLNSQDLDSKVRICFETISDLLVDYDQCQKYFKELNDEIEDYFGNDFLEIISDEQKFFFYEQLKWPRFDNSFWKFKKDAFLAKLIERQLNKFDININGSEVKFSGYVSPKKIKHYVIDLKQIFKEQFFITLSLSHGVLTHYLQFYLISRAFEDNYRGFKGLDIEFNEILKNLFFKKIKYDNTKVVAWAYLIDNVFTEDTTFNNYGQVNYLNHHILTNNNFPYLRTFFLHSHFKKLEKIYHLFDKKFPGLLDDQEVTKEDFLNCVFLGNLASKGNFGYFDLGFDANDIFNYYLHKQKSGNKYSVEFDSGDFGDSIIIKKIYFAELVFDSLLEISNFLNSSTIISRPVSKIKINCDFSISEFNEICLNVPDLTKLYCLDFSGCEISGDFSEFDSSTLENIKEILLEGCRLNSNLLAQIISQAPNLKILDLAYCKNTSILFDTEFDLAALEKLYLENSDIDSSLFLSLFKASPSLKILNISNCLNIKKLDFKENNLLNLKEFYCAYSTIDGDDFFEIITHCPNLEIIDCHSCLHLDSSKIINSNFNNLIELNVAGSNITIQKLQEIINNAPNLKILDIRDVADISRLDFSVLSNIEEIYVNSPDFEVVQLENLAANSLNIKKMDLRGCIKIKAEMLIYDDEEIEVFCDETPIRNPKISSSSKAVSASNCIIN